MERRRISVETIVSVSALLLSLCGVGASIVQTRVMLQQQRAIVWPHLELATANVDGWYVEIANKGTGPATIRSVEVELNGTRYPTFIAGFRSLTKGEPASRPRDFDVIESYLDRRTLRPGESVKPIQVRAPAGQGAHVDSLFDRFFAEGLRYRIVYASIYDECWVLDDDGTKKLDACP